MASRHSMCYRFVWTTLLDRPYVVLTLVSVVCIGCIVASLLLLELPSFSDPTLGFETRGTQISSRLAAYDHLLEETVLDPSSVLIRRRSARRHQSELVTDTFDEPEDVSVNNNVSSHNFVDNYFCDIPRSEYAKLVFQSQDSRTLWTATKLRSMCRVEEENVRQLSEFSAACIHTMYSGRCCRSWSAVFRDHIDVPATCWDSDDSTSARVCVVIPHSCRHSAGALYHLFYHVLDTSFLHTSTSLTYAVTFLPVARGIGAKDLYDAIESHGKLTDGVTGVVAMDFGIKHILFDGYLIYNFIWFILALAVVVIFVWLYTESAFITVSTFIVIFFAIFVAYFLYGVIFRIHFFPFINLLAVVVLFGIGVDDVFVYMSVWGEVRSRDERRLVQSAVLRSTKSAFASSATTAAAFFSGAVASDVIILRCFGLFAGLVVVSHFVVLAVVMPALIRLNDRWLSFCTLCHSFRCKQRLSQLAASVSVHLKCFIAITIPRFVDRFRYLVLVISGIVGAFSIVGIFVYPKLRLPTSNEFQLFTADHPLEVYDIQMKAKFWFSRTYDTGTLLPVMVVFGAQPVTNMNPLDPLDRGSLEYDEGFDVGSPQSRNFLSSFCRKLRQSKYYQPEAGFQLTNCFVENFERYMRRGCEDIYGRSLRPCCGNHREEYNSTVFHYCVRQYASSLSKSAELFSSAAHAGPRFSKTTGELVAVIVEFASNEPFSLNYSSIGHFYTTVNEYVDELLSSAPDGLGNAFFVSYVEFYDLQHTLASGIPVSTGIALAAAVVVAFLVTLNAVVAVYAVIAVLLSICGTVAVVVCLGWRLNVVESVTISLAAGLTVDFTLHYAVAYCLTTDDRRRRRARRSARVVAAPVAMSAVTTILVGAVLTPASIVAYRQIGVFLMTVVGISWIYTTVFFQALVAVVGPRGRCAQLQVSRDQCVCRQSLTVSSPSDGCEATRQSLSVSSAVRPTGDSASHTELQRLQPDSSTSASVLE